MGVTADPMDGGANVRQADKWRRRSMVREGSVGSSEALVELVMMHLIPNQPEAKGTDGAFH
jgi:hypothetical protein